LKRLIKSAQQNRQRPRWSEGGEIPPPPATDLSSDQIVDRP